MTKQIYLPFFNGFYGKFYSVSSMLESAFDNAVYYDENGDFDGKTDNFDFDGKKYMDDFGKLYTTFTNKYMPSFVKSIRFVEISSPAYYNYSNDKINAEIDLSNDWKEQATAFLKENEKVLQEIIKQEYADRDGFMSFISTNLQDWFNFEPLYLREILTLMCVFRYAETDRKALIIDFETYRNAKEEIMSDLESDTLESIYEEQYLTAAAE